MSVTMALDQNCARTQFCSPVLIKPRFLGCCSGLPRGGDKDVARVERCSERMQMAGGGAV
eukprot:5187906-Amphidinium_carterae.1